VLAQVTEYALKCSWNSMPFVASDPLDHWPGHHGVHCLGWYSSFGRREADNRDPALGDRD
jgi:hypothetical protein